MILKIEFFDKTIHKRMDTTKMRGKP